MERNSGRPGRGTPLAVRSPFPRRPMPPELSRAPLPDPRLRVLQVADGDPALADALRQMMWHAYCEAGRPLGPDEDGMWAWWAFGQQTTVQ